MAVFIITAEIECDDCGEHFKVGLDPAYVPPAGWSLFDVAVNTVRGGVDGLRYHAGESTSVQEGAMLCAKCTRSRDAAAAECDA